MTEKVLISNQDYLRLRYESRETLARLGIRSNPAWSNSNILTKLIESTGAQCQVLPEVDDPLFYGEMFRDSLGELLGLELPPRSEDVINDLRAIAPRSADYDELHL